MVGYSFVIGLLDITWERQVERKAFGWSNRLSAPCKSVIKLFFIQSLPYELYFPNSNTLYHCIDGLALSNLDVDSNLTSTTTAGSKEWDPWHPPYAIRVPRTVYSIVGIYMSFVLFLAISLNGLVLYTAYKNRVSDLFAYNGRLCSYTGL